MNKSFTLLELIIVVLIIGILTTLAMSNYGGVVERHWAKEGEANLELIYNAEKRYSLDHRGAYFICATGSGVPSCREQMMQKENLGLEITDSYFDYLLTTTDAKNKTNFTATATRKGSDLCAGKTMSITELDGPVQKGCNAW